MKTILVVGTYDTKDDELRFLTGVIQAQGGRTLTMDVGVLGEPKGAVDLTKHDVAAAAGHAIAQIANAETENHAMQMMADGAAALALRLWRDGRFDGVIVLGGSMGTAVGRILNDAIRNAVFSWGIDINFTTMRVRTGTLAQPINVVRGTGYYGEMMRFVNGGAPMPGTADRWNPLDVAAMITGETVSSTVTPLITIPVYDTNMRANLLTELPLRNARIRDMRLTANRNCIGTAIESGALGFNSCGPLNNNWRTTENGMPAGVLEAVITVADAKRIQVVSLNMPLCTLIAGGACTDAMGVAIDPAMFTVPANTMIDGQPGWTLTANVAAVAANIAN